VEAQGHVAALVFYQRLFEIDPSLRPLFRNDIEAQAGKLMEMLTAALAMMEKPGELRVTLEALGARHVG
jgi:hemoglobin-like flavoprotein